MAHSVWHAKGEQADDVRNFYLAKRCKPSAISKCHAGCNPRLYSAQGYPRSSMRGPRDAAREPQETAHEHGHKVSASPPDWLSAGDAANASMGVGVGVGVGGSACMPVCLSFRMKVCVLTYLSVCMQADASDAACLEMRFCAWTRFCARECGCLLCRNVACGRAALLFLHARVPGALQKEAGARLNWSACGQWPVCNLGDDVL